MRIYLDNCCYNRQHCKTFSAEIADDNLPMIFHPEIYVGRAMADDKRRIKATVKT